MRWYPPHDFAQGVYGPDGRGLRKGQMIVIFPPRSHETDVAGEPLPPAPLMVGRSSDGDWRVIAHLGFTERNELVAYRLEIRPWAEDAAGVTTTDLRNVPLGRWLAYAHSWVTRPGGAALVAHQAAQFQGTAADRKRLRREALRIAESTAPKPGPKGLGEKYYRRLALDYLDLQAAGKGRGIRGELARRETARQERPVSDLNIRDHLTRATSLGFLAPGTPGRTGRLPGANLYPHTDEEESG